MRFFISDTYDAAAVFVGEVDEGKVVGFHNWIQFHFEERAGRANYLGHLLPRGRQGSATHVSWTSSHAHRSVALQSTRGDLDNGSFAESIRHVAVSPAVNRCICTLIVQQCTSAQRVKG